MRNLLYKYFFAAAFFVLLVGFGQELRAGEFVRVQCRTLSLQQGDSAVIDYTLYATKPNRVVEVMKGRSFWNLEGKFLPVGRQSVDRAVWLNGRRYFKRHLASVRVKFEKPGEWLVSPVRIFTEKLSTQSLFENGLPSMALLMNNFGKKVRYEYDILPLRFEILKKETPQAMKPDKILSGKDIDLLLEEERQAEADRRSVLVTLAIMFGLGITGGTTVRRLMKKHNPAVVYFGEMARFLMSGVNKDTRFIPKRSSEKLIEIFHELYASPHHHELDGFIDRNREPVLKRVEDYLKSTSIRYVFFVDYRESEPPVKQVVWADPPRYAQSVIKDIRKGTYSYILTEKHEQFLYIWLLSQDIFNAFCRDKYFLEKLYAQEITSKPAEENDSESMIIDKNGNIVFKAASKKEKPSERKMKS